MTRRHQLAIAVGALAVASGGAALGFELSSRSTYDASTREPDDARQNQLYESANRKYEAAQGFAIGATACVIGAVVLWVSEPGEPSEHLAIAPILGGGATLTYAGTF